MSPRPKRSEAAAPDLFSIDPSANVVYAAEAADWPDQRRFPLNRPAAATSVRRTVRVDLLATRSPLIIAGYSSIAELVDFFVAWGDAHPTGDEDDASVRLLLGAEPYATARRTFASARADFTDASRRHWEERRVNVRLSAALIAAIEAIRSRRLQARFIHGQAVLHAKLYVGDEAATVGSSNFSDAGLAKQLEANARFEKTGDARRYAELQRIGENLWHLGEAWDDELRELLEQLLRFVGWREALAAAAADLLEGEWARRYVEAAAGAAGILWPSQRAGIGQALWIIDTVGSALVADATGSGKTKMGAHLVRAVSDRLWSTGRIRHGRNVVVCPPAVEQTWKREAVSSGVHLSTVSHGLLSHRGAGGPRTEEDDVNLAQVLAVDESHNFLNPDSRRTKQVRGTRADHVLLFTATPINRGAADLLQLVAFLGADNFSDETIDVLRRLERRRGSDAALSRADTDRLRREIQTFTVRRTKAVLNALVEREPHAYLDPLTERVARYPRHDARVYDTGETEADAAAADSIRSVVATLAGIAQLERTITVPASLRREYTDERWLSLRLTSVAGLARHHVLSAMRSSRAALVEHVAGTAAARERYGLPSFKATDTGDVIGKLERLAGDGPPAVELTGVEVPIWLADHDEWAAACTAEAELYREALRLAGELSDAREQAKRGLLLDLVGRHDRVLAFDRHPVTLEYLRLLLVDADAEVIVATGSSPGERRKVEDRFGRTSTHRAIALCSDAMNEGLNLQGASAIVHLDLPTTLRVAEQRIGRVDRMDSPHDSIEAWWPRDGRSFATRANELLAQRAAESEALLGSNLQVPSLTLDGDDAIVRVEERIEEAESPDAQSWDGIRDALQPVRDLIEGDTALVEAELYEAARAGAKATVVSAVASDEPWAFLAIAAGAQGAPRWLLLEGRHRRPVFGLDEVAAHLRARLAGEPADVRIEDALDWLGEALDAGARAEHVLLPRRTQRALDQLARTCRGYAALCQRDGDQDGATRWFRLASLADVGRGEERPDPDLLAEVWRDLVRPHLDAERKAKRNQSFVLLREIDKRLAREPLDLADVERAVFALPAQAPFDERVSVCILGVAGAPVAQLPAPRLQRSSR